MMDPIAKAKMVALKGIKRVLAQDPMVVPSGVNRYIFFNYSFPMFTMGFFCLFFHIFSFRMNRSY